MTYEPEYEEDEDQPARRRCRHIFPAGRRCGSPCLRTEQFCYHHHTTRRPVADPRARRARTGLFDLPEPEDRESIRAAVAQVMHAIAHNDIDLKRAGMVLYSLQIALCTFPPQPRPAPSKTATNSIPLKDIAEDIVVDETHGVIAPEAEYEVPKELRPRKSLARQLLDEVELYEARHAAEKAQEEAAQAARDAGTGCVDGKDTGSVFVGGKDEGTGSSGGKNAGAPRLDSVTWVPPSPQNHPEPKSHPHRPAAIDLRAAADTEDSQLVPEKPRPILKMRHPERSLARLCAKRSRRICGSRTRPQLPIMANADFLRE